MKQLSSILFIMCLCYFCGVSVQAQDFSKALETAVQSVDQATSEVDWKQARSRFERLAGANAADWLPWYYVAYVDIELSFRVTDPAEKQQYLQDAETCLDMLKKLKITDPKALSEVNMLRGYRYFALMAIDPATNGPRYAGVVAEYYGEALKQNPDNPRAIFCNAQFQHQMAAFMGGAYKLFDADIERAQILFASEAKDTVSPHWGRAVRR